MDFKSEHEEVGDLQVERGNVPNPGQAEKQFFEEDTFPRHIKANRNPDLQRFTSRPYSPWLPIRC